MEKFFLQNYSISKRYVFDGLPAAKTIINTINPHSWVVADQDPAFSAALEDSDVLLPDGVGIVLAAKLLWKQSFCKMAGYDLQKMILTSLNKSSGRCFYLGASPEVLACIREKVRREYPNIE